MLICRSKGVQYYGVGVIDSDCDVDCIGERGVSDE